MLPERWSTTTIGDQVTLQRGIDITRVEQRDGLVPVISSGGVSSFHDTYTVEGPGVVLGRKGVVGSVYFVTSNYWPHDTTLWVKDFKGNDQRFVYYFFKSIADRLSSLDVGSANPTLNRNHVHPIAVSWPPLDEQKAIAAVLGALDDKIEQNRRTGRALEELARATFKAWFVDFEPVKANAAGQKSFEGMPPAAFAALPDSLIDSPIGPVPQGWGGGTMGEIGQQRREQVVPGEVSGETPYVGLEHMPRRDLTLSTWGTASSVTSSKFRFHRGDILFGKLRPYFHKVGPAPLDGVCSTDIVVLHPKRPEYAAWLLMLVSGDDFVAHTDRSSAGTKMPRTNWKDMAAFPAALPPPAVVAAYQDQVGPMLDTIRAGIHESSKLAALRDYLLPQLLNGRVRVHPSLGEAKA